jgi:APA family basic amino acid/polyamine antiporter
VKFAAIAVFVVLGLAIGKGSWSHFSQSYAAPAGHSGGILLGLGPLQLIGVYGLALIGVFWAYDGWVYITWVAGEVKDPQRNVPRALFLGVLAVGVIYVSLNVVYLYAMPVQQIAQNRTVAHAAATALFSPAAAVWLSAMIAVSCFGAMASCILSGGRVYYAMAQDGVFFQKMAEVHPRWRTPAFSLIGQGMWSGILALSGRYDQLYTYVMFMMVLSYVAGVAALFLLRRRRPDAPRPYRCTGYPWLPIIYLVISGAWALNTIVERPKETLAGTLIVLAGVPGFIYWRRMSRAASPTP